MQKTKNPLIFIIEDSVVYKDLIVGHLQSKKFANVKTFDNPDDCMKELDAKPDIIVLDYTFGGISGLELMKKVKAENPEIDFIFISGQNDVEIAVKIMKLGAADYVVKNEKSPYRLVSAIEQLLLVTKTKKMNKGFQIGVVGFFLMLFLVIVLIILITIVFNL
jgi:DNA-binding NtrC family response regulator